MSPSPSLSQHDVLIATTTTSSSQSEDDAAAADLLLAKNTDTTGSSTTIMSMEIAAGKGGSSSAITSLASSASKIASDAATDGEVRRSTFTLTTSDQAAVSSEGGEDEDSYLSNDSFVSNSKDAQADALNSAAVAVVAGTNKNKRSATAAQSPVSTRPIHNSFTNGSSTPGSSSSETSSLRGPFNNLRKWNTDAHLFGAGSAFGSGVQTIPRSPILAKSNSTGSIQNEEVDRLPYQNPLKKWRESHVKELEKSLDMIVLEEEEEEEEDVMMIDSPPLGAATRSANPSTDKISDVNSLIGDEDFSDDDEEDESEGEKISVSSSGNESLLDDREEEPMKEHPRLGQEKYIESSESTFGRPSSTLLDPKIEEANQSKTTAQTSATTTSSPPHEEKKSFLQNILTKTKQSLTAVIHEPTTTLASKENGRSWATVASIPPPPTMISKIPKPTSFKVLPTKVEKTPLLKRLYNLSKPGGGVTVKERVPLIDFSKLGLFDDLEEGEFDGNDHAHSEMARFLKTYKVVKQIGSGGHSTVRLVTRTSDNVNVVAKFIHATNVWEWEHSNKHKIPLEISTMKSFTKLGLKEVIKYLEHYELGQRYIIIMEYLGDDWCDLYDFIEEEGPVKEDIGRKIFRSVVTIVQTMHKLGCSHNDIKDENVMINKKTLEIKLIDFGSTMALSSTPTTTFYGTQKFSAPEALGSRPYILAHQEVWALGTLLYVLLFKMDPFANDDEIMDLEIGRRIERVRRSSYGKGLPPINISDEAAEAIEVMLSKNPDERPEVLDLLDLSFFSVNDDI